MERERINAAQREALMALYGCFSLLEVRAAELTGIAGRVKYGKRDFKMLLRVMEKLVTNTLDTLPMEQLKTVQRAVRMSCVRVSANDYTGKRGDDWLLSRGGACIACERSSRTVLDLYPRKRARLRTAAADKRAARGGRTAADTLREGLNGKKD